MNINKVTLAGRLTRDPEIKYTPSGTAIADFSLAVTRYYKNTAGESQEDTDFIDVTAFGRSAEIIQKHLKKANPIYLDERLKLDTWETNGQKRSKLKVIAESMQFVGPRLQTPVPAPVSSPAQRAAPAAPVPAAERQLDSDLDVEPQDIPFRSRIYKDVRTSRLSRRVF